MTNIKKMLIALCAIGFLCTTVSASAYTSPFRLGVEENHVLIASKQASKKTKAKSTKKKKTKKSTKSKKSNSKSNDES